MDQDRAIGGLVDHNIAVLMNGAGCGSVVGTGKGYSDEVRERVQTILHRQIDKYAYLKM